MGIRIEGLSFRYPGRDEPALDKVTLAIPDGGIFGLLGPNGAGKTTLIAVLTGQLRGASGRFIVDGRIGLVPQDHALYPMLTCMENLRFFGAVQGLTGAKLRQRVDSVAAFARIEGVMARRAGQLSGGLKRRLNVAIGLLTEPEVLLLDEPTVGVDPQARAFLLESIRSLAAPGRTIVYTSHYMEEVQAICDRIAILDAGRVLVSGTLTELLDNAAFEPPPPSSGRNLEQLFMQLTSRSLRDG